MTSLHPSWLDEAELLLEKGWSGQRRESFLGVALLRFPCLQGVAESVARLEQEAWGVHDDFDSQL